MNTTTLSNAKSTFLSICLLAFVGLGTNVFALDQGNRDAYGDMEGPALVDAINSVRYVNPAINAPARTRTDYTGLRASHAPYATVNAGNDYDGLEGFELVDAINRANQLRSI